MAKQTSQYDKILRENIESVIPGLMQHVLGIVAIESEELPDDSQHTKERKPDVLKKITDNYGNVFVLQIEFQVADELKMVYRMAEYYIMLARKYEIPVRQFVIYLGSSVPEMPRELDLANLYFTFPIVALSEIDYQIFLRSDSAEEVVLSILGDFREETIETALTQIIQRVEATAQAGFPLQRLFNQLRILAQLRNLGIQLQAIMDSIDPFINEEQDVLYLRGFNKGETKGEAKGEIKGEAKATARVVKNLLSKMSLTVEQVADIAGVSTDFVKEIQQRHES